MKREAWAPLALAGLAVIFAAVCIGLWLSRGNHWWLKRKLRIGALMLTLTGVANGCTCAESCYLVMGNQFTLEGQMPGTTLTMDLLHGNRLSGEVKFSSLREEAPFEIVDGDREVIQSDTLEAQDGAFDERDETFFLTVRGDIQIGDYTIAIYDPDYLTPDGEFGEPIADFRLAVVDSRDR